MHTTTESLASRIHERLSRSKFLTVSIALHAAIVVVLGGIVIVRNMDAPVDMTSGPGYSLPMPLDPPKPDDTAIERPPDFTPDAKSGAISAASQIKPPVTSVIQTSRPSVKLSSSMRVDIPQTSLQPAIATAPAASSGKPGDMFGRFQQGKDGFIRMNGKGNTPEPTDGTERAVLRGLAWLQKVQNEDGSWGERNRGAMTGLALLCYLGHGEYGQSPQFGLTVNRAIEWMLQNGTACGSRLSMTRDGWGSGNSGVYEHGIGSYALGEYYTMTMLTGKADERVVELFRGAITHILEGQGIDGGWMYDFDKTQSDTSVSGWQVQALKTAHLSGLKIPGVDTALDRAMLNFQRVQTDKGGYGYRKAEDRWSLTGVGLLCELFWRGTRDTGSRHSVEFIMRGLDEFPIHYQHEKADLYAWYYHTQALLMFGGSSWKKWNDRFSSEIVKAQSAEGSWPPMLNPAHGNLQKESSSTGAIYRTTLCVLMLESYYRYLPANRE